MALDPDTKQYLDQHFGRVNDRLDQGDKRFDRIESAITGDQFTPGSPPGLAPRVADLERRQAADEAARATADEKRTWWQRVIVGGLCALSLERIADYFLS